MSTDIIVDFEGWSGSEKPIEPNWEQLRMLLQQADDWLRCDDAVEFPGGMETCEAAGLLQRMLDDYDSDDDRVRAFVSKIEWAAFWIQGKVEDPELQERVQRLCETSGQILADMAKASKAARA